MSTDVSADVSALKLRDSLESLLNVGHSLTSLDYCIRSKHSQPTDADFMAAASDEPIPNNGSWAAILQNVRRTINSWWLWWRLACDDLKSLPKHLVDVPGETAINRWSARLGKSLTVLPARITRTADGHWAEFAVPPLGSMDEFGKNLKVIESSIEDLWGPLSAGSTAAIHVQQSVPQHPAPKQRRARKNRQQDLKLALVAHHRINDNREVENWGYISNEELSVKLTCPPNTITDFFNKWFGEEGENGKRSGGYDRYKAGCIKRAENIRATLVQFAGLGSTFLTANVSDWEDDNDRFDHASNDD